MKGRSDATPIYGISTSRLRQVIARVAELCGLAGHYDRMNGKFVNGYSGHSMRIGAAINLADAGFSNLDLMNTGRWASPIMPAHYTKQRSTKDGAMAQWHKMRREGKPRHIRNGKTGNSPTHNL